jgi:hypothetical protein
MSATTMRPRGVGEILDAAINLYVGHARTLMGLAAVVVVPLQILAAIVLLSTIPSGSDVPSGGAGAFSTTSQTTDTAAALGARVTLEIAQLLVGALVTAACVKAVSDIYLDQPTSIGGSLRFALRRLFSVVWLQIVMTIGLILGFVALIIPGIYLYAAWSVAVPGLLIERRGAFRALGRSRRLVKGRWWPTAGVILVATIMVGIVAGILGALLGAIAGVSDQSSVLLAVITVTLAGAIGGIITEPFRAAAVTVLYYDLRVRREGYDLHVLADQLGLPPSALPEGDVPGADGLAGLPGGDGGPSGPYPIGPESVGQPGGPPYWPPPPGWEPGA